MTMTATKRPRKPSAPSLTRPATSWGDEYRQAYRQAKTYFEAGAVTYDAVADRVSLLVPVSQTTVMRLGYLEDAPQSPSQRQIAWLSLVAMGYDPSEFGLQTQDRALRGLTDIEIRKILDPGQVGFGPRGHDDED